MEGTTMMSKIYIIGEMLDIERLNNALCSQFGGQVQVEILPANEIADNNSANALILIYEQGRDLLSSGMYDIVKQSLIILFQNIKTKKDERIIKIVIGNKSCVIKTNFDMTNEQERNLAETAMKELF